MYLKLFFAVMMSFTLMSCDNDDENYNDGRLIKSFEKASPQMQRHIAEIVEQAKAKDYKPAMNSLALLQATIPLTKEQKISAEIMVRQLRYDLEEGILNPQSTEE